MGRGHGRGERQSCLRLSGDRGGTSDGIGRLVRCARCCCARLQSALFLPLLVLLPLLIDLTVRAAIFPTPQVFEQRLPLCERYDLNAGRCAGLDVLTEDEALVSRKNTMESRSK